MGEILQLYNDEFKIYLSAFEVKKNLFMLGIITDLLKSIKNYSKVKSIIMISDAARMINQLIKDSDAPFIYERTGTLIRHFMIDEFQDTSVMQWENFKPLILNSLSEGYSNWIVGDVKQSIYRWRNSDWTILSTKIYEELYPFSIEEVPLTYNWRSSYPVICFNNTFFRNAVNNLLQDFISENNGIDEAEISDFTWLLSNAYNNFGQYINILFK